MIFTILDLIDGAWEGQRLESTPVFPPPVEGPTVFQHVFESLAEGLGNLLLRGRDGQMRRNVIRLERDDERRPAEAIELPQPLVSVPPARVHQPTFDHPPGMAGASVNESRKLAVDEVVGVHEHHVFRPEVACGEETDTVLGALVPDY